MAHEVNDSGRAVRALLVFISFCFASSAAYIVNDVVDAPHDKRHRSKRRRPIAANEISRRAALMIVPVAAIASLAIAASISRETLFGVVLYLVLSALYTLLVKRLVLADVILLAGFYSLRVLIGGAATGIVVSRWLLAFSSFLFISLSLAKRYADLSRAAAEDEEAPGGRAYTTGDREVLLGLGTSSGLISVLVFALYLNSSQVTKLYSKTDPLWLVCALLVYWIGRMWLLAHRGQLDDDPIVTATTDPASYIVAAAAAVIVVASI
jgi:4-hydroxybenzoate polyprenyltransferase